MYDSIHPPSPNGLPAGLALIFDMDGVLVDSNPVHREAWVRFNLRYGVETTAAMLERMYGKRNDDIVRDFFGDELTPEEVAARGARKEQLYREMVGGRIEEILVPGLRPFLDRYSSAPLAVASNAEPENVRFVLDRAKLGGYFRVVVDGHQVSLRSPIRMSTCGPPNCWGLRRPTASFSRTRIRGSRRPRRQV